MAAVSREFATCKLHLLGVQEARLDKGGTGPADDCTWLYVNGNADHHLGAGFIIHKETMQSVWRVEFVSDRISYDRPLV